MFFLFNDVQHSAKFFLNATFQMPILHLMSLPEMYLDLDPEKTAMRLFDYLNCFYQIRN